MASPNKNTPKGTTLIENAIAVTIMGIVIVGLIKLFITVPMNARISSHMASAANLAQEKIEQLKALGYNGIVTAAYPQQDAVVIDAMNPANNTDDLNGVRTTSVADIPGGEGKKIVVTVTWAEFNHALSQFVEIVLRKMD